LKAGIIARYQGHGGEMMSSSTSGLPENLELRIRRARSWLERAEDESEDSDAAFIFLWIAFNAAYGKDKPGGMDADEHRLFDDFFETLLSIDVENSIHNDVVDKFAGPVRMLLENRYVHWQFWLNIFGMGYDNWESRFEQDKREGLRAVLEGDTREVLNIIFDRLYIARNQIMHGGATWKVGRNREQVRDGVRILVDLVPLFVNLMERNPQIDWGPPDYRVEGPDGSIL